MSSIPLSTPEALREARETIQKVLDFGGAIDPAWTVDICEIATAALDALGTQRDEHDRSRASLLDCINTALRECDTAYGPQLKFRDDPRAGVNELLYANTRLRLQRDELRAAQTGAVPFRPPISDEEAQGSVNSADPPGARTPACLGLSAAREWHCEGCASNRVRNVRSCLGEPSSVDPESAPIHCPSCSPATANDDECLACGGTGVDQFAGSAGESCEECSGVGDVPRPAQTQAVGLTEDDRQFVADALQMMRLAPDAVALWRYARLRDDDLHRAHDAVRRLAALGVQPAALTPEERKRIEKLRDRMLLGFGETTQSEVVWLCENLLGVQDSVSGVGER